MDPSVERLELALVCSHGSSNDIPREHYGPGRTVGKILDSAGNKLDVIISKSAERLGYGPRVTAQRIRARSEILHVAFSPPGHVCVVCSDAKGRRRMDGSPSRIAQQRKKTEKDIKSLLKYVDSNVPLTRRQAIDHILDLSTHSDEALDILKSNGAAKVISDTMRVYSDFRFGENDDLLLSSSRKALISLGDTEINHLLKRWHILSTDYSDISSHPRRLRKRDDLLLSLWDGISEYLRQMHRTSISVVILKSSACRYPDFAFLIVRALRRNIEILPHHRLSAAIFTSISSHPPDFEWDEFEPVFHFGSHILVLAKHSCLSPVYTWLLKYASRSSQILDSEPFKMLYSNMDNADQTDSVIASIRSRAVIEGLANEDLTTSLSHCDLEQAHPFFQDFNDPVVRMVTNFISENWDFIPTTPNPKEYDFYKQLVSYLDSPDASSRRHTWKYVNYFLAKDAYRCNMMLSALSSSSFGSSPGFQVFAEAKLQACLPRKLEAFGGYETAGGVFIPPRGENHQKTIYRHYCHEDGSIHLNNGYYNCNCDDSSDEEMLYSPDWILRVKVTLGEAFSSAEFFAPVAAIRSDLAPGFIAELHFEEFECSKCNDSINWMYAVVTDGTMPEDLFLELQCPHRTSITLPWSFDAWVLRYAPAAYAKVLGCSEDMLHTTGFFSWKPSNVPGKQGKKIYVRVRKIERIAPGTEVSEEERSDRATVGSASPSDYDDECLRTGSANSVGTTLSSESFDVAGLETDLVLNAEAEADGTTAERVPRSESDVLDKLLSEPITSDEENFGASELKVRGIERVSVQEEILLSQSKSELAMPRRHLKEEAHEDLGTGLDSVSLYEKGEDRQRNNFGSGYIAPQNYFVFKQSLSLAAVYIIVFVLGMLLRPFLF